MNRRSSYPPIHTVDFDEAREESPPKTPNACVFKDQEIGGEPQVIPSPNSY